MSIIVSAAGQDVQDQSEAQPLPAPPVPPAHYVYYPVLIETDANVPIQELLGGALMQQVNTFAQAGWEVILPALPIPAGGRIVGGQKKLLWNFWVRCLADSPLHQQAAQQMQQVAAPTAEQTLEMLGAQRQAVVV